MARTRFAQEVVAEVRQAVGPDYPIICKIDGSEYVEGGTTLEDAKVVARILEGAGADAFQVSVGQSNLVSPTPPSNFPQGCFVPLAAEIKKVVSIPVIAVGRIHHLEMAEEVLQQGKADLVAMGRSLIADPKLMQRAMEGRLEEVKPCIACSQGCITRILSSLPMLCSVNPEVGREGTFSIKKAKSRKKVLIAGGGPSGLEAARVAQSRGHQVSLFEKSDRLGGYFNIAALVPYKEQFKDLIEFYKHEMERLGVEVRLNVEVDVELIKAMRPDIVVVATGSVPFIPQIKGIEKSHVVTAVEVLTEKEKAGNHVVILGGGRVGCETAEFLAIKGKDVTLVEEGDEVGNGIPPRTRMFLIPRLIKEGVKILKRTNVEEIEDSGVRVLQPGKVEKIQTDTVLIALGFLPQTALVNALEPMMPELKGFFMVGDCAEPRTVQEAVYDGWQIGRMI
jgi:thioredoxin reductase